MCVPMCLRVQPRVAFPVVSAVLCSVRSCEWPQKAQAAGQQLQQLSFGIVNVCAYVPMGAVAILWDSINVTRANYTSYIPWFEMFCLGLVQSIVLFRTFYLLYRYQAVLYAGLFFLRLQTSVFCFQVSFCLAKRGNRAGSSRNESDYSRRGTQTSFPLLQGRSCENFELAHFSIVQSEN